MFSSRRLHFFAVLTLVILSLSQFLSAQQNRAMVRPLQQLLNNKNKAPPAPPVLCAHDTLVIYQDCRMCVCARPNRVAKCYKKSCDLRTKDSGQCPPSYLKMDDGGACQVTQGQSCKVDSDCPGPQLCCFEFCDTPKCVDPIPLDGSTGMPMHSGRGFQ